MREYITHMLKVEGLKRGFDYEDILCYYKVDNMGDSDLEHVLYVYNKGYDMKFSIGLVYAIPDQHKLINAIRKDKK